jgi:NhaA family Na+:H+ antiporter
MTNSPSTANARIGLLRPFQEFFRLEASGGILLLLCAAVALAWANSPWASSYFELWQTIVTAGAGDLVISKPLLLWINDGLMAIFFFVVGLEIKREVLVGELSSPGQAALPLVAALGGMVVPALFYVGFNTGTDTINGWGVPMATDIAFALGILALLGPRAPLALKIFLTALAIVDDLGAVLVIALFYTAKISLGSLMIGAGLLVILIAANRLGIRRTSVYVVLGLGLWVAFLKSGVHATIAGVLLALTIPARRLIDAPSFRDRAEALVGLFAKNVKPGRSEPTADQQDAVHALEEACQRIETPLARMEHALHGWVAFGIMPLFALANAGVAFGSGAWSAFGTTVTLGILFGLFVGKQVGVFAFSWVAVRMGWAIMPTGITWRHIYGVSCLTGVGFTMALFISNLAFSDASVLDDAKIGIFAASLLAGLLGWALLRFASVPVPRDPGDDALMGQAP